MHGGEMGVPRSKLVRRYPRARQFRMRADRQGDAVPPRSPAQPRLPMLAARRRVQYANHRAAVFHPRTRYGPAAPPPAIIARTVCGTTHPDPRLIPPGAILLGPATG